MQQVSRYSVYKHRLHVIRIHSFFVVVCRVQLLALWTSSIHIYFYNYILAFIFVSYFLISTCLTLSWILFYFFLAFFWIDFFHSISFPSTGLQFAHYISMLWFSTEKPLFINLKVQSYKIVLEMKDMTHR